MKNRFIADKYTAEIIKAKTVVGEMSEAVKISIVREMTDNYVASDELMAEYVSTLSDERISEMAGRKYKRNAKGEFATVDSRGAGKGKARKKSRRQLASDDPNGTQVYGNDPKAPSKVAEKYGLNVTRTQAKQRALLKEGIGRDGFDKDGNIKYKTPEEAKKWQEKYDSDLESLNKKLRDGKTTDRIYGTEFAPDEYDLVKKTVKRGEVTAFNRERTLLHNRILAEEAKVLKKLPSTNPPVLSVIMGRPGSGKGSFEVTGTERDNPWAFWKKGQEYAADPDYFKVKLGIKNNEVSLGHEESSYLNKLALQQAVDLGKNIVLDQTLASDKSGLIQKYKDAGYDVKLYGVSSPISTSIVNAAERYTVPSNGFDTGRLVPTEVSAGNITNEANFEKLIPLASEWKYYTNQLDPSAEFGFTQVAGSNL